MGVSYDPKYGIQRIEHSCGAQPGWHVTAHGDSYLVVDIDGYGCYVCSPLNGSEEEVDYMNLRTFDDLDIDSAHPPIVGHGEGI